MRFFARFCVLVMCGLGLSACQTSQGPDGLLADPGTRVFNFDWRLSGDPQVGPMQVFDNGARIWLHFAPEQMLPAVLGRRNGQEVLLPLKPLGQFQVIEGLWTELIFRAGRVQAQASLGRKRVHGEGSVSHGVEASDALRQDHSQQNDQQQAQASHPPPGDSPPSYFPLSRSETRSSELRSSEESHLLPAQRVPGLVSVHLKEGESASAKLLQTQAFQARSGVLPIPVSVQDTESTEQPVFELRIKDKTLRQALVRWAKQAEWVFAPEHWTLEVDFPIKAAARFEGSFESAVAQLLVAAQLNAHPLQACFYSNQVLRVLAWPQACDPGVPPEGQS
ncbi:TcpQ domain-containing protein [Alcaligenes faecalis]|uniref:TcpQ domain-containing protein n=1 Tax=Alcaligenes faecalis TaxID=511 RepID=UPI001555CD52|nr:TcpQ domain-containing protein [Alcaligenes faecalis]